MGDTECQTLFVTQVCVCEFCVKYELYREDSRGFGIGVTCGRESVRVGAVTEEEAQAVGLFRHLSRPGVFPCHLVEVLEDLLSDGAFSAE